MVMVVWHGVASDSVEHLDLTVRDGKYRARSIVDLGPEQLEYAVELDPTWTFIALSLRSSDGRTLELARDDGEWHADGSARPDLAEAVDIDLAFSPFTNTLPIRRLELAVGEAADIVTAYVDPETFTVTADPQRYTRLATDQYLYESRDSDFRREITVDDDGLVVDYPGLFTRVPR
ncbi:putative glycolipid-binding domain-containing protein [Isoptericola croceus]|uniref:putative glycolipid-binding domain-containing protein n=1 Tax=Isoptericola croceus TaxID=3031406 RepID=UPI0023F8CBD6|nr:putative glycolipid-binding domain-containing protein [Isoptericola croceus]